MYSGHKVSDTWIDVGVHVAVQIHPGLRITILDYCMIIIFFEEEKFIMLVSLSLIIFVISEIVIGDSLGRQ